MPPDLLALANCFYHFIQGAKIISPLLLDLLTQVLARLRLANLPVGRQVLFCSSSKFIPVAMATKRNFSSNKTKFGYVSLTQHWVSKSTIITAIRFIKNPARSLKNYSQLISISKLRLPFYSSHQSNQPLSIIFLIVFVKNPSQLLKNSSSLIKIGKLPLQFHKRN